MDSVISEYQKWKQHGESLRVQARQAMEVRFRDLLTEAMRIGQEYHADFGVALKPPPAITAFRFKAGGERRKRLENRPRRGLQPRWSIRNRSSRKETGSDPHQTGSCPRRRKAYQESRRPHLRDRRRNPPGGAVRGPAPIGAFALLFAFHAGAAETPLDRPEVKKALAYIQANHEKNAGFPGHHC